MELLANIEKHSGAGEVTVLIRGPSASDKMQQGLLIFISDDGKGLDSKLLEEMNSTKISSIKNLHFGLQNIKLRLNEIGGSIKFLSEEGEGTEVEIRICK
jgi:two-component system NarL family sensor kinase